jgi:hypothetical protein
MRFNFFYLAYPSSGRTIFTWSGMWKSVVIFRKQRGPRLGRTAIDHSDNYAYHILERQKSLRFATSCIFVFRMILRIITDCFFDSINRFSFCDIGEVYFLWGRKYIWKFSRQFQPLNITEVRGVNSGWILQIFRLRCAQCCHIRATYPTRRVPSGSHHTNIRWSIHLLKSSVMQISPSFLPLSRKSPLSVPWCTYLEKEFCTACGGSVNRRLTYCHLLLHAVWCVHCGSQHCRYHFVLQCAVGLLTACYRVTILLQGVQWVCLSRVTVLPFYVTECAVVLLTACYSFIFKDSVCVQFGVRWLSL